jgi:hypothetical protein
MLYNNLVQTSFIGHNFVGIYETTPIGNLDKIRFVEDMTFPLQKAFQCNIPARISIGIDFNSAFLASEQGIVTAAVSTSRNSTAVRAELGSMPTINDVKCNPLVKTTRGKNLSELSKRHSHNDLIKLLSFRFESFEILNGNIGIEPQSATSEFYESAGKD